MARTARPQRTETASERSHPGDRAELERQIESLQREVDRLRAVVAKGPSDETWFTPGVLGVLALGIFFALWFRYEPMSRQRPATAAVETTTLGEYNPPPAAPAPAAPAAPGR
jgi:hypothetical protein